MKKMLSILGAISLVGTSTTSLVACNKQYSEKELADLKEKNNITTKDGVLEWIAPQEKPFNKVDNKWYYVVSRVNKNDDWHISKFKNNISLNDNEKRTIDTWNERILNLKNKGFGQVNLQVIGLGWTYWWKIEDNYFKTVYRWNLDTQEPDLIVDNNGNVKVNGE